MSKQDSSTRRLYAVPKAAPLPKNSIYARLLAALGNWQSFFARPIAAAVEDPKAKTPPRKTAARSKSGRSRAAARTHLRVVHTGTRI